MSLWKCQFCNWDNSEKWNKCSKCGKIRVSQFDFDLINIVNDQLNLLAIEIEKFKINNVEKWEYLQISSDEINSYGGIDKVGLSGWELVAAPSYEEGGGMTINGFGGSKYIIKVLYIFKRRVIVPPKEMKVHFTEIISDLPIHLRVTLENLDRLLAYFDLTE
jgi:hypothetical protein